MAGVGDDYG